MSTFIILNQKQLHSVTQIGITSKNLEKLLASADIPEAFWHIEKNGFYHRRHFSTKGAFDTNHRAVKKASGIISLLQEAYPEEAHRLQTLPLPMSRIRKYDLYRRFSQEQLSELGGYISKDEVFSIASETHESINWFLGVFAKLSLEGLIADFDVKSFSFTKGVHIRVFVKSLREARPIIMKSEMSKYYVTTQRHGSSNRMTEIKLTLYSQYLGETDKTPIGNVYIKKHK